MSRRMSDILIQEDFSDGESNEEDYTDEDDNNQGRRVDNDDLLDNCSASIADLTNSYSSGMVLHPYHGKKKKKKKHNRNDD